MDDITKQMLGRNVVDMMMYKQRLEPIVQAEVLSVSFTTPDNIELHVRDKEGISIILLTRTSSEDRAVHWLAHMYTLEEYVAAILNGDAP